MDFDLLTHELKKAFAQLDVTEKQEAAKAEKLQRKTERAARRKAARRKPVTVKTTQRPPATTACSDCGKPTKADDELYFIPVQCNHCQDLSRSIDLGIHPRSPVDFSFVHIVPGGAPGLGRRK
ncbi:hypothetical protein EJA70_24355 [Pseudomonas sp. PB103]|uniref:hypothetical protein n=1 Tax=Pseudomonas sp. PB103 TaxID=2494698 RepID=UPI00131CBBB3|nr:hypothetical protein [Pseudomonas sp. PB103]KAE9640633.1 hypothetical protein EJA70_24355 [Pseudomonas sp. PB103]